jgi:hypothetical protein
MKSFKSIREGNYAEPGVSEINDVPEDPMSFVEIKPKKTKVVKEGIVDSAANARVRIFSSIDRKKKELYKNAVKEDMHEAVSVKKANYSFGRMMTVHHGSDTSYPLHPENQQAIAKLKPGEKTSFKDETNSSVHAEREGDTVHLTRPRLSSTKTSVAHSHFNEETEQIDELNKDTLYSYAAKAEKDVDKRQKDINRHRKNNNPIDANKTMSKTMKRFDGMDRAKTRLNKEETEQGVAEGSISDLLNRDPASPKFNDHPAPSKTKHSGSIPTPYEQGRLDAHRKKPYNNIHKDGQDAGDYKTGYEHVKSKQGVAEASIKTLKSYLQKVSSDSMKHKADPTKRSPEKANRSVAGFAKAQNRLEKNVNEEWVKTGKTGTHIASGQKTFEWAKVNDKGDRTGERHYRNASGKVMGEELEEGIKSKIAGIALSALAAHGAAHGRVTFDDEGGHSGGYKPTATATASTPSDNKPATASPNSNTSGFSKEYLQRAADPNRFGRHMSFISPEKAAEHLKKIKEETISELKKSTLGSYVKKASDSAAMSAYGAGGESQRNATKAIVAKHYGEPVSKRPDTYGADRKVALKRLKGIGKATDRLTKEETVLETKGAPKGFHFTKDGKLKRGDADQDGNGGPMLRTDPLDKQRNKVPAVSEGIDFFKVWESIKPEEIVVEAEAVDPIVLKREADILMASHIAAHKAK